MFIAFPVPEQMSKVGEIGTGAGDFYVYCAVF